MPSDSELELGRRALMGGNVSSGASFTVSHAKGSELWDLQGNRYLDCTSQAWSLSVGHCHDRVLASVRKAMEHYTQIRTSYETEPKLLLAKKLSDLAPWPLKKVAFSLSGSEAIEGAMKLALRNSGMERSSTFVTQWGAFHGRTLATLNMSWPHSENVFSTWSGPVVKIPSAYCYRCPVGKTYPGCHLECVDVAKRILEANLSAPPAAIVLEPFLGNGGMVEFPPEYLPAMQKLAKEIKSLLILDEIQTGMGRMGEWFASESVGVVPDMMVIGKGLGGGFPLFSILVDHRLDEFHPGDHSFSFGHFPLSMVAALETISIIQDEGLLERSKILGQKVKRALLGMQSRYEFIGDVRGIGLMIGVELVKDRITKEPACELTHQVVQKARESGLLLGESKYGGLGNVIKFKPPLNIPEDQVDEALDILNIVFKQVMDVKEDQR
ncbi:MAG: aspartate aminotransferase family protein [Patescibacteria group bacterium]|nr:aspartate aminotransferase family protein [Patescibacteria group bacterium]